jgi:diadenosine tetraphosphate (Ap4A) HIT family hydrolase
MAEGDPTIFDKILSKEIPATVVYEDDLVLAFKDINPQAPFHCLVIPKNRDGLTRLARAEDRHAAILGHMMVCVAKIAKDNNLEPGYRLVVNDGPMGCQEVLHLHLHILGGSQATWPPGTTK